MSIWFKCENGIATRCETFSEFHVWSEGLRARGIDYRMLLNDELPGGVRLSTVFLGLDHSWGIGEPILWESMVFGGANDQYQWRYRSEAAAREGHAQILAGLQRGGVSWRVWQDYRSDRYPTGPAHYRPHPGRRPEKKGDLKLCICTCQYDARGQLAWIRPTCPEHGIREAEAGEMPLDPPSAFPSSVVFDTIHDVKADARDLFQIPAAIDAAVGATYRDMARAFQNALQDRSDRAWLNRSLLTSAKKLREFVEGAAEDD